MAWIKRLAFAVILLAMLTMSTAAENTYGKTHAEVLKMGRHKWFAFYTSKAGESTVDMCDAERIFGDCLAESNDRLIAKRKVTERDAFRILRKHAREYGGAMVEVGTALTGGGTMWDPVEAGVPADGEEMLSVVLDADKRRPAKASTRAAVLAKLNSLRREIVQEGKQIDEWGKPSGLGRDSALASLARARKELDLMLAAAGRLGPRAKREALAFAIRQTNDLDGMR